MLLIISKVLVVFIYLGIGFAANKLRILPAESSKYFINLIMEITVPCLMLSSITGQEIDGNMYRSTIITFVVTLLLFVLIAVLTTFTADTFFRDKEQQDRNVLATAMTGCNSGFMGYPIAKAVFGPLVFYYLVIQTISNNMYIFVISLFQLHHRERKAGSSGNPAALFKPLLNLTTIVTVVSIGLLFAGIKIPSYFMDIITTVGDVTIPVSMMLVGIQLAGTDFKTVFADRDVIIAAIVKLVAAPALIMLVMIPMPFDPIVKMIAVFGMCFPTAVMSAAMAAREEKNPQLISACVATSTLLSMCTLPVWILICSSLYLN